MPYKNNMYEFVEKLDAFCKQNIPQHKRCSLVFSTDGGIYLNMCTIGGWNGQMKVIDSEDFEEQCYKGVKWMCNTILNDQEYEQLFQQPKGV